MGNNELKFLKYLDNAVNFEKGRYGAIENTGTPFSILKILMSIDGYKNSKLKTLGDFNNRVIENKVLKNTLIRRAYELFLREGFEAIDFNSLSSNVRYQQIKNKILKNDPDLMGVNDDMFLRQIANAIAHGNYISLFNFEDIEKSLPNDDNRFIDFDGDNSNLYFIRQYGVDINNYDAKTKDIITKMNKNEQKIKVSPKQLFMQIMESRIDDKAENLHFKYESNYKLDANGQRIKRPSTAIYDLEISYRDIDELLLFMLSALDDQKLLFLQPKQGVKNLEVPDENTFIDDAMCLLNNNDICVFDPKTSTISPIVLDGKQKEYFIDEYVRDRELFDKKYYKNKYKVDYVADLLTTNATTQTAGLGDMLVDGKVNKLAYVRHILDSDLHSYYIFTNKLRPDTNNAKFQHLIREEQRMAYSNKQMYNVYAESLISETLLLLQILEDKQQLNALKNNPVLLNFISNINATDLANLRSSSKYSNDTMTIMHHLRNSLTHLNYLQHSDGRLSIYDQVSKRNKDLVYKFDIDLSSLALIKSELYSIVAGHNPSTNKLIEQDLI